MDVRRLLDAMRNELRTTVLPRIEGEYERSVVVAMLGILRDLGPLVVLDERPVEVAATELRRACDEWIGELGERPLAGRLAELVREADAAASPAGRRERLLEAAETLVSALWRDPALGRLRETLLPRVRSVLKTQLF